MFHKRRLATAGFLFQCALHLLPHRLALACAFPFSVRLSTTCTCDALFFFFFANGRVRRRRLFIYSARWPGVKGRKCLFFCPLSPSSVSPFLPPSQQGLGTKCSSLWPRFSLKINPERKKAPPSPSLHLPSPLIHRHSPRPK